MRACILVTFLLLGCGDANVVDVDCTAVEHCHLEDGEPTCDDGYTWEDASDPDNRRCVLVTDCEPETDATLCAGLGANCGLSSATDRCGELRTVSCGTCSGGESCGGAGVANQCGAGTCVAESDAAFCERLARSCGSVSGGDNCGDPRTAACGTCSDPARPVCSTDGLCVAESCTADCTDRTCGSDGCNGSCGTCSEPEVCGALTPGQCDVPTELPAPTGLVDIYYGDLAQESAMAIDSAGTMHVAFTNPRYGIKYGRRIGGIWRFTLVDPSIADAQSPALAVDADGWPTIAYFDATAHVLRVSRGGPQGWRHEVVDADGYVGRNPSLALDASGRPHIAYWDQTHYNVKYARWDGSWHTEALPTLNSSMQQMAIAIDGAGGVWIASANTGTALARKTATGWDITDLPALGIYPHSLGFDSTGAMHLVGRPNVTGIRYATNRNGSWQAETVEADTYWAPVMFVDGSDTPHLVYSSNAANGLFYAVRGADGWSREQVNTTAETRVRAGLVVDSSGEVLISFRGYENLGPPNDPLKLAEGRLGSWAVESLDAPGNNGTYTSLALDAEDRPRIAYYHGGNSELRYAAWDGAYWWSETVDGQSTRAGSFAELALDSDGVPHIAYRSEQPGELRYATWNGAAWQIEVVDDDSTYVGQDISLELDDTGSPHLSYLEGSGYDLRYAHRTESGWVVEVIDSYGTCGEGSSLALDSQGRPHISYLYDQTNDLRYARWTGTEWQIENVATDATVVGETAIAIGASDRPCIGYHDIVGNQLVLTCKNASGVWTPSVVDAAATAGRSELSLLIDATGVHHLAYWYTSTWDVTYANDASGSWSYAPLEYSADLGGSPSLALDSTGHALVATHRNPDYYSINGAVLFHRF